VNEQPPAELLRRLTPIPTYRNHPATSPHDVDGVDPSGSPVHLSILERTEPILLLFLSSSCHGCLDLWEGLDEIVALVSPRLDLAVVTRGEEREDVAAVAELGRSASGVPIIMSSPAFADYAVAGPPFLVVVDGTRVRTEGVAWGIAETTRAALASLSG
jgi:thiol-disulfide isomerase/thioredoxin